MSWPTAGTLTAVLFAVAVVAWLPGAGRALDPETADDAADFPNYYFAGERLVDGDPIYDELSGEISALFGIGDYDTYPADPPSTVVLFTPLSALSYRSAWIVWQIVSASLIAVAMWIAAREVGYRPQLALVIVGGAFVTLPVRFLLTRNHMESVLLLLGVLGWRAMRRGSVGRGAVWAGLAAGLKLFPGMWVVGLVDRQRWRAAIAGAGVALFVLLVGVIGVGWDNVEAFVGEVIPASERWQGVLGNYSLLSVGTAFVAGWFGWVLLMVGLVVLLPRYLGRPSGPDRLYAGGTALALLISPLSWLNYLVLAIPALLILSVHLDLRESRHRIGLAVLVVALAAWGPIVTDSEWVSQLASFVPTYGLVALFFVAHHTIEEESWPSTSALAPQATS